MSLTGLGSGVVGDASFRMPKVTAASLRGRKGSGTAITAITAYDTPTARLVDEAGIDVILVGDSVGNAVLGYADTLPVTMDEMVHHARAVRRGVRSAFVVADMPYGSYHVSEEDAVRNALRFVKEAGAEAVKLEGGRVRAGVVRRLVEAEVPVVGHIGLTPQSVNAMGGYKVQGKTVAAVDELLRSAEALEAAGVLLLVLEGGTAGSGGADYGEGGGAYDRDWGGAGVRWADPGVSRRVWAYVCEAGEVYKAVWGCGGSVSGRAGGLPGSGDGGDVSL